jgi:hypothetical protein
MDVEEQFLLPLVEAAHPADVKRVRSEHQRIRALAEHLAAAVELRTVRQSALEELASALTEQSEREDRKLYHFAWEQAPAELQHRIAALFRAALRSAHEAAQRTSANRSGLHPSMP